MILKAAEHKKCNRADWGFTLIELLIAVSILVLLSGMMMPAFTKYVEKAREQRYITEAKAVCEAAQLYLIDMGIDGSSLRPEELSELLCDREVSSPRHVLYPYLTQRATRDAEIKHVFLSEAGLSGIKYSVRGYTIIVMSAGEATIEKDERQ